MFDWLKKLFGREPPKPPPPPPPPPREDPQPPPITLELVALPGHGKTSFLWGLMSMATKLSVIWPNYLPWSQDAETENAIQSIQGEMEQYELPPKDAEGRTYYLMLRRMQRWGDRPLVVRDDRDPVFGGSNGSSPHGRVVNWGVPVCWLVDLGAKESRSLDSQLNELVRARLRSARSFETQPLKLVVALTKADRLPNLPFALRQYLKDDLLATQEEAQLRDSESSKDPRLPGDSQRLELYLKTLWNIHGQIADWLSSTLTGSLLVRRAIEHHVELRFCLISPTGSDLLGDGHLDIGWRPHRVIDPLFWALELGSR